MCLIRGLLLCKAMFILVGELEEQEEKDGEEVGEEKDGEEVVGVRGGEDGNGMGKLGGEVEEEVEEGLGGVGSTGERVELL